MTAGRIKDLPENERPREKLGRSGAGALTDSELLAIFFRTGNASMNAVELGRHLIKTFGSLEQLSQCSLKQLMDVPGIGPVKAGELRAVFEMGQRLARTRLERKRIDQPHLVYELLAAEMQALNRESLRAILLDTRYRLIMIEEISLGSLNESVAHPREILRPVFIHSAYAMILVHNHPSGDPSPSASDRRLTARLAEAANLLRIELLDHVIIGSPVEDKEPYFSFRESGLM